MPRFVMLAATAALLLTISPGGPGQAKVNPIGAPAGNDGRWTQTGTQSRAQNAPRRASAGHRERRAGRATKVARRHKSAPSAGLPGSGRIVSRVTGATAAVSGSVRDVFQRYVDAVEAAGGRIKFMHGIRAERCAPPRHKHACGWALDVCQHSRDVVDGGCHLPGRQELIAIADRVGLTEGGQWCRGDRGHVEYGPSAGPCGSRRYAAGRGRDGRTKSPEGASSSRGGASQRRVSHRYRGAALAVLGAYKQTQ